MTITYAFSVRSIIESSNFFFLFQTREWEKELFILVQLADFIIFGKSLVQSILIGFIARYSKICNQN
jgi:hypothetical protein